ncbi:hypothetical protein MPDQ_005506 [Monascus purpureus]|uniref:CNH domain-containing protein n=1 Tax=Monascus purpureus TaxID=5098 RepID=A0A507R5X1_MONPU|nr:hypothetical protein MPDQ_005506 [Monascus purpureus]
MGAEDGGLTPNKRRKASPPKPSPYVLRLLLDQVPLTADDTNAGSYITCVEYWNGNLYIGTSTAEILHYVCLPSEPSDESSDPTFIFASRLSLPSSTSSRSTSQRGVQQIVLLPTVKKACILCNGVVTFYMLPELSPAFQNTNVNKCCWIGGLDLDRTPDDQKDPVIMVAFHSRIMLVRIGHEVRPMRHVEFPGCLVASRRGTIACVADALSYSLLDVEHKQKIYLFPISSSSEIFDPGDVDDVASASSHNTLDRSPSAAHQSSPTGDGRSHSRSSSLNAFSGRLHSNVSQSDRSGSATPDSLATSGTAGHTGSQGQERSGSPTKDADNPVGNDHKPLPALPKQNLPQLKPHIVSPTSSEFLLITGTGKEDPGVGMFVNTDGEVVPGSTMNFTRYPESIVVDGGEEDNRMRVQNETPENFVLAVVEVEQNGKPCKRLEIQQWGINPGEEEREKIWVEMPSMENMPSAPVGLRHTTSPSPIEFREMGKLLQMVRLQTPSLAPHTPPTDPRTQASIAQVQEENELFESQELIDDGTKKGSDTSGQGWEAERNTEEVKIARGLGNTQSSLIMWSGNQIWRVPRNPLTIQLDNRIQIAQKMDDSDNTMLQRDVMMDIIQSIQSMEPGSEAEFLGLNYVKQKASLLLFGDLLFMDSVARDEVAIGATEQALVSANIDPRVVLLLLPLLREDVLQGPQGIWIHAGLAAVTKDYIQRSEEQEFDASDGVILDMVKRFLFSWQQKRGYPSITDETYVFDSVDAALLHLLLEQDSKLTVEQRRSSSTRLELNRLVDNWKGNFDGAVVLLENYSRLYVLSRLYQSRKMSGNVLKTWRRILDGEKDVGGEITPRGVEVQMRKYLVKIKDAQLVEEYGSWLAGRNPDLGVQVFADNTSRVKLEPPDVVNLLKERAPNAAQVYLEHLVFAKNYIQYADDLISYYLDTVLSVLHSFPEARESLSHSYSTYRALRPPKPTYMNFITENAPPEPWWQSRMRLLQLLGGGSSTQFTSTPTPSHLPYSIPTVLERIEPFQNELVSECIILDGLQGRHREALRLLTHGLGDYDSAIRYCLFGGPRHTTAAGSTAEFAEPAYQSELFKHLLDEFLQIQDPSDRIERTSDLLARFASSFDVRDVLTLVPDDWSVDILSGFLVHVFRTLLSQTRETRVQRALSASLNLRVSSEYIDGVEKAGGWIENADGLKQLKESDDERQHTSADGGSEFGDIVEATTE